VNSSGAKPPFGEGVPLGEVKSGNDSNANVTPPKILAPLEQVGRQEIKTIT